MNLPDPLITCSLARMSGTPVFAETRVPIQTLFHYLAAGETLAEFLKQFPDVSEAHAIAVISLASKTVTSMSQSAAAA